MFSHMSARRFPKDRKERNSNVGPGSYEVPSFLDSSGIFEERFEGSSSVCESSFSIFIDELDADKPLRTPRGGVRQPFGKSTKENIVSNGSGQPKSARTPKKSDDEGMRTNATGRTPGRTPTSKAKERSVAELQKRVEELESAGRDAQAIITGLEADKADLTKTVHGSGKDLRESLKRAEIENHHLLDQLEIATSRNRVLKAAEMPTEGPQALMSFITEVVDSELDNPRKVFCLQRKAFERQAEQLRRQTAKLELKVKDSSRLSEEAESSRSEAESLRQLVGMLQEQLAEQQQQATGIQQALEASQLEERLLRKQAAEMQEEMDRYMDREAKMGQLGSTNLDYIRVRAVSRANQKGKPAALATEAQASPPSPGTLLVTELTAIEDELAAESLGSSMATAITLEAPETVAAEVEVVEVVEVIEDAEVVEAPMVMDAFANFEEIY